MNEAVEINVPEVAETVRSPTDALGLVAAMLVALGTAVVVIIFPDVFGGLGVDLNEIFEEGSGAGAEITGLVLTAIALTVPLMLVVYFVWAREFRRLATVLLAAAAGAIATALAIELLSAILGDSVMTPERGTVVVAETAYYPYVAAITAAITAAAPWMPRLWRRVAWVSLGMMVIIRLFLGSNLPAELVLALSLGVAAGSGVLFLLGSPNRHPSGSEIVATLRRSGIEPARIDAANVDARGSTPYFVVTTDGDRLFVKTLSTDERSADILFRLYRRFRFTNIGDEPAFSSLRRAVEHEALLAQSAAGVGVRTPKLAAVGRIGDEDYSMLLAQQAIEGRSLDSVDPELLTDSVLAETWQQVAILRRAGIAHRDLRLANVFLDDHSNPWIIDFGFSELAASDLLLQNDIAEFVTSSALLVGPEQSVRCAVDVLGPDSVSAATRRMQGAALSGATKGALKERDDDLLEQIRAEIANSTGRASAPLDRITRLQRPINRSSTQPSNGDES
jgi:undecaprenyl-diphosphatase